MSDSCVSKIVLGRRDTGMKFLKTDKMKLNLLLARIIVFFHYNGVSQIWGLDNILVAAHMPWHNTVISNASTNKISCSDFLDSWKYNIDLENKVLQKITPWMKAKNRQIKNQSDSLQKSVLSKMIYSARYRIQNSWSIWSNFENFQSIKGAKYPLDTFWEYPSQHQEECSKPIPLPKYILKTQTENFAK